MGNYDKIKVMKMTKKLILSSSIIATCMVLFTAFIYPSICPYKSFCWGYIDTINFLTLISLPLLLMLPFSLITYKMRNEVFEYWRNFSLWYLPAMIVFTLILISGGHGGDFAGVVSGWFDGVVILALAVIYAFGSFCLILKKRADFKK